MGMGDLLLQGLFSALWSPMSRLRLRLVLGDAADVGVRVSVARLAMGRVFCDLRWEGGCLPAAAGAPATGAPATGAPAAGRAEFLLLLLVLLPLVLLLLMLPLLMPQLPGTWLLLGVRRLAVA